MDEVLESRLRALEERVHGLEVALDKLREPVDITYESKIEKAVSLKEFILQKTPHNDVQKTLIVCYYVEKFGKLTSFNIRDIENAFRSAKEPVPDNINYKIIKNIEKGYVMEAAEKRDNIKAWTLTGTGEKIVDLGFND